MVVIGRGKGQDRAGNTLAEQERVERYIRLAEAAGMDLDECLWYREAIEKLYELATPPITRDDIDEMAAVQSAMAYGLDEAGIPDTYEGKPLVPDKYRLYDLQWRHDEHVRKVTK